MLKESLNYKAVIYATIMVSAMWFGFLLQNLGVIEGCNGAIIPLTPSGLKGIFFSPFLHGGIDHIFGNSVPIFVLIFLLFQFYPSISLYNCCKQNDNQYRIDMNRLQINFVINGVYTPATINKFSKR